MNTTKLTVRITARIIIFIAISIIISVFLNSPIISNELALTQMQNSNELYLTMEAYNKIRSVISVMYSCITGLFAGVTIYDIYKLINTKNKGEKIT